MTVSKGRRLVFAGLLMGGSFFTASGFEELTPFFSSLEISTYEGELPEDALPDLAMMEDLTPPEVAKLLKYYLNSQREYVPSLKQNSQGIWECDPAHERHWGCNPTKGIDLFKAKLSPIRNCSHLLLTVLPNVREIKSADSEGISFLYGQKIWDFQQKRFLSEGTYISANLPFVVQEEKRIQRVLVHLKKENLCAIIEIFSKERAASFNYFVLNFDSYATL